MFALIHSVIDREEHEKYLFLPPYENMGDSICDNACPYDEVKGRLCFVFSVVNIFLQSVLNKKIAWQTLLQSLQLLSLSWSNEAALYCKSSPISRVA